MTILSQNWLCSILPLLSDLLPCWINITSVIVLIVLLVDYSLTHLVPIFVTLLYKLLLTKGFSGNSVLGSLLCLRSYSYLPVTFPTLNFLCSLEFILRFQGTSAHLTSSKLGVMFLLCHHFPTAYQYPIAKLTIPEHKENADLHSSLKYLRATYWHFNFN